MRPNSPSLDISDLFTWEEGLPRPQWQVIECCIESYPPLWIEEGLAQMFQHDVSSGTGLMINPALSKRHKKYWSRHGLDSFWDGSGFSSPGKLQSLCYELAEILLRLLLDDHRPTWFGLRREKQEILLAFLRDAESSDAGAEAAHLWLGYGLPDLASRFFGPLNIDDKGSSQKS